MLDNFDDRYLGAKTSDPALDNDGNALVLGALYFNSTDGVMKVYTASGWIAASSASVATLATFEFVATSGQTVFSGNDANGSSLSYVAPALIVTLNGVRLRPGDDYTATNGTSITLISAAALNDELVVDAFGAFLIASVDGANIQDGTTNISKLSATGTRSSSTFLAGDNSFKTVAGSKWTTTGSDIYYNTGNVGIGTSSPQGKLAISASGAQGLEFLTSSATSIGIQSYNRSTSAYIDQAYVGSVFTWTTGGVGERMRIDSSGNVGIGTGSPTAFLHAQRTSGTTQTIGLFEAAVGGFTGTSLVAANTLGPDSAYNLFSCISDSDADAGGPYTEFRIRGDGLLFMDSGFGSAGAAYGCRAWVNFNGTGTPSIRGGGNVSSITDSGTGFYRVNFTNSLPDGNYSVVASSTRDGNYTNASTDMFSSTVLTDDQTTTGFSVKTGYPGGINTVEDSPFVRCAVFR